MPVVGYKKNAAGETLGIFYNDLWDTTAPRYLSVESDIQDRDEFQVDSPQPQPHTYGIPSGANYAIALQGNVDTNTETEQMKLIIPQVNEPDWGTEDKLNEKPVQIKVGAQIVDLTPGQNYAILKFEDSSLVPNKDFIDSMGWTKSW